MAFLFGFFRFLTWGNIVVVGFFMLFILMSLLIVPSAIAALMSLLFLAVVLYHNILCTQLQRSIANPNIPLPASLPRTILIAGVGAFIYAVYVAVNIIITSRYSDEAIMKMMDTSNMKDTKGYTVEQIVRLVRKMVVVFGGIHAAAIAVNCELSRIFFNRWRKEQQEKNEEENSFFDINNP